MTTATDTTVELSTDEKIGQNVHGLLWVRRIQQKELAAHLGFTSSVMSKKLRGTSGWSASQVDATARFLSVTAGRLFEQPTVGNVPPKLALIVGGGRTTDPILPTLTTVPVND